MQNDDVLSDAIARVLNTELGPVPEQRYPDLRDKLHAALFEELRGKATPAFRPILSRAIQAAEDILQTLIGDLVPRPRPSVAFSLGALFGALDEMRRILRTLYGDPSDSSRPPTYGNSFAATPAPRPVPLDILDDVFADADRGLAARMAAPHTCVVCGHTDRVDFTPIDR